MISSTPIFACSDVEATITFYKDVLGFDNSWTWGEPPNFGCASKGGVSIMFALQPDLADKVRGHMHWVKVEEVEELYRQHKASGAKIVEEIEDRPWGCREYVVEDLNGYCLRFAGPPLGEVVQSRPFPEGVRLERTKPSQEEFNRVAGAAFGWEQQAPEFLEGSWAGVVARTSHGQAIGVLRIMRDAPGWFSIWDVAVLPDWQAQRIGSQLMKEALAMVGEASPGAFVYLFTFKDGFYERLGFGKQTVSIRQV